jgi:hypothetical protein
MMSADGRYLEERRVPRKDHCRAAGATKHVFQLSRMGEVFVKHDYTFAAGKVQAARLFITRR